MPAGPGPGPRAGWEEAFVSVFVKGIISPAISVDGMPPSLPSLGVAALIWRLPGGRLVTLLRGTGARQGLILSREAAVSKTQTHLPLKGLRPLPLHHLEPGRTPCFSRVGHFLSSPVSCRLKIGVETIRNFSRHESEIRNSSLINSPKQFTAKTQNLKQFLVQISF